MVRASANEFYGFHLSSSLTSVHPVPELIAFLLRLSLMLYHCKVGVVYSFCYYYSSLNKCDESQEGFQLHCEFPKVKCYITP